MTALALIAAATAEAHAKHGRSFENAGPRLRLTIMMEELGEIARAVLDADEAHVLHEVAQLSSLGFRWLEADTKGGE